MKLSKFECKSCGREFWQEIVGKSITEVSRVMLTTKCPECQSEKIVVHAGEYEVVV